MPGLEGHVHNCEMKLSSEAEGGWLRAGAGLEHMGGKLWAGSGCSCRESDPKNVNVLPETTERKSPLGLGP